ncbi:class I SAM-dependent methyltransferase [Holosporaceae bacterium 'Namur']|nr:class I SAM-dependent methyltransferase [Holosporaceae bacterium 'Namur']
MKKIFFLLFILSSLNAFAGASKRWYADNYAENALLQQSWATKFFFQDYIFQGDESILDIGSGVGNITAMMANYVPHGYVIGIDSDEAVVNIAKQDYKYIKNLSFLNKFAGDANLYNSHKEKFDIITSFSVLHWISNNDKVLKGMFTALKPNGICYLRLASKGGDPVQDIADRLVKSAKWKAYFTNFKSHMKRFTVGEYAALLEKNNFQIVSIRNVEDKNFLNNTAQLKMQIKSWLPYYHHLKSINSLEADKFINEIVNVYISKFPVNQNGSVILYDHNLEIVATKPAA